MLTGLVEDKAIVLMLNDADLLADGMGILTDKHFKDPTYRQVFQVMKRLYDNGDPVTPITIAEPCRTIQGFSLAKILSATFASKSEFGFVCEQLEDIRKGQEVYKILADAENEIREQKSTAVIESVIERLFAVSEKMSTDEIIDGKELAFRTIDHINKRIDKEKKSGLYTQWPKLNRMIGAFEPGDLVIISAPTGAGKSAFCQNIFQHLSIAAKVPGLYVNSEMSEEQMSLRWAAMLGKVEHSKLRAGDMKGVDYRGLVDGIDRLCASKFACVTIPDLSIDRVSSIVRRYKKTNNVQAVAVDYIGRMDTMNAKLREDQVLLNAAKRLKTLAQQCQVVMFMVAQVRKDGNLQSASYMENEADLHLRIEPLSPDDVDTLAGQMLPWNYKVHIQKGRNCQKGWTYFQFLGEYLLFRGEE